MDKDLVKVWNDDGARKIVKIVMDLIQKHVEVYIDHTSHMTEGVLLTIDEGGKPVVEGDLGNDVIDGKNSDGEVDMADLDDRDKETDEDKGDDDNYEEKDSDDGDDLDVEKRRSRRENIHTSPWICLPFFSLLLYFFINVIIFFPSQNLACEQC